MKLSIKKFFFAFFLLFILILSSIYISMQYNWFQNSTLKIGAIISLTGSGGHLYNLINSMAMAVEEINKYGGINERKIQLIIKDSKTNALEGKKAFNQIEKKSKPLFYISTLSTVSTAISPLAKQNQVILFGLAVSSQDFTKINDWTYRYYTSAQNEIPPIIFMMNKSGVKELGILYLNDVYGSSVYEIMKDEFLKIGKIPAIENFTNETVDFRILLKSMMNLQAIYVVGFTSHLKIIIPQLKELKYKGNIYCCSGFSSIFKNIKDTDNIFFTAPIIYKKQYSYSQKLNENYQKKYGLPITHQAAIAYDLIKLIKGLIENKELTRKNLKRLLEKGFIYPGIFGDIILQEKSRDLLFPLYPAQVVNGNIKYLW